jgi:hypothetical protein
VRSFAVAIVLLVGALMVPVATVGWWLRDTVVPTTAYVETVAPLATDKAVVAAVEKRLTQQTMDTITRVSGDRMTGPVRGRVAGLVRLAVGRVVADPAFAAAWRTANRVAHDDVVAVLSGGSSAVEVGPDSTVYVELTVLGAQIRRQLGAAGVRFASSLPVPEASLPIGHTEDLVRARTGYSLLEEYGRLLPVATLVLIGLGLLVARRRMQALGWTAFVALGGLGVLAGGIVLGRIYYLQSLPSGISQGAATAVFDTVTAALRQDMIVVAAGALALLLLSAVLGRRTA